MASSKQHILIVEDDPELSFCLRDNLEQEGYEVTEAADGATGLELALTQRYDLILLDIMLPQLDGYSVCKTLRTRGQDTAIIVISARGDELDKVLGLDLGADDYVAKPFGLLEILARVRAVLRRGRTSSPKSCSIGGMTVDFRRQEVSDGSTVHRLSHLESQILAYLAQHEGEVVSRQELYGAVWGEETHAADRSVDHHIVKLRRILEPDTRSPRHILTVYGTGYRLAT